MVAVTIETLFFPIISLPDIIDIYIGGLLLIMLLCLAVYEFKMALVISIDHNFVRSEKCENNEENIFLTDFDKKKPK